MPVESRVPPLRSILGSGNRSVLRPGLGVEGLRPHLKVVISAG